ncbi:hypothetical protein E4T56_gene2868 [Termitomyces sp. T112]|nr:hypothetical protein E4T56_gene2868 [Termitomyces sp. T112]
MSACVTLNPIGMGQTTLGAIPDLEREARTISPANCAGTSPNVGPEGPTTAADNSDRAYSSAPATTSKRRYSQLWYIACTCLRSRRPSESSKEEVEVCADGEGDAAGEYVEDNIGKVWELQNPNTTPSPPLQCSTKLPNPRPPSAPTSGNSNTSSADPNGSLINSNTFSAAVDASPEFPWTPEAFSNPGTIRFPTDPIRMSPRPVPRLHPTTVDSAQFRQAAAIFSALWSCPVVGI